MKKLFKRLLITFLSCVSISLSAYSIGHNKKFSDKYDLQEMVVLSRHNIRAPLSGNGSALANLTSHQWTDWSAAPSELTLRGGVLETIMGQYFRKYLAEEGLFEENYVPTADDVNIYANSMQRTMATAQYFASGFMPTANLTVNHRFSPSKMDPVFNPRVTKLNDAFKKKAMKEIAAMGGKEGIKGINEKLKDNYTLIAHVLDLEHSPAAQSGMKAFDDYNTEIIFKLNEEPSMKGSLKDANSAADAFILQYYEEPDSVKAGFGQSLSREQWAEIAEIKDVYGDVLFAAPTVAVNVANPLLRYIFDELNADGRKFTFLVGHDSNIASVNAALGVESYELPNAIEKKTPIGSKLVIEKWKGKDGKTYVSLNLVYQSVDQLRNVSLLDLENPPMVYPFKLKGLTPNEDGLYLLEDVNSRFLESFAAYEAL